jgi:two-component system sensor histidine kinase SenX3
LGDPVKLRLRAAPGEVDQAQDNPAAVADDLAEQRRRVRLLTDALDALPVGVLLAGQDGTEIAHNRRYGAPTNDLATNVLVRRAVSGLVAEAARTGNSVSRAIPVHGPPPHHFEATASPLAAGGVVACLSDVSERQRLVEMRRDFTVNATHELRTPIGAIGLLAETLQNEDDTDTIRRLAARIVDEAERVRTLLEGLLNLSRIEAADRYEDHRTDLDSVVEEAVSRLDALAERRTVTVQVDTSGSPRGEAAAAGDEVEGPIVRGDASELTSAVANLLDNAIKYSPAGGRVTVTVRRAPPWAEVEVADEGIGIPQRDLDRIFERFYRVDRGRARHSGGVGLGLAIVRHVAENHGGEVCVSSREGEGSRFVLRLPLATNEDAAFGSGEAGP